MSSVATSVGVERSLVERLRHPMETPTLVACIVENLALVALALVIVQLGSDWLEAHPTVAGRVGELRLFAIGVILAWPLTVLGRQVKVFAVRANGVRVAPENMPELHEIFVEQCRALRVEPLPELYLLRGGEGVAVAYPALSGPRACVVLDADLLFATEWKTNVDCIAFAMGDALGSLSLGHTRWWVDMTTAYAMRIPVLRAPVLRARTYSRDRCAAFVAREGVRGLLVRATGKDLLPQVDVAAFIRESLTPRGFWERVGGALRPNPRLHERVRLLYESGFFDLERDLARWGGDRRSAP